MPPEFVKAYEQIRVDASAGGHGLRAWALHADAAFVGQWSLTDRSEMRQHTRDSSSHRLAQVGRLTRYFNIYASVELVHATLSEYLLISELQRICLKLQAVGRDCEIRHPILFSTSRSPLSPWAASCSPWWRSVGVQTAPNGYNLSSVI